MPYSRTVDWEQLSSDTLQNITGGSSSFVFWTKTCRDCNFFLQLGNPSDQKYQIVFGGWGNGKATIHKCEHIGQCENQMDSYVEKNLLSCIEFRSFWLSWQSGVISIGKGVVVGDQQFMSWTPQAPIVVNYVSISPYTSNVGTWLFAVR